MKNKKMLPIIVVGVMAGVLAGVMASKNSHKDDGKIIVSFETAQMAPAVQPHAHAISGVHSVSWTRSHTSGDPSRDA